MSLFRDLLVIFLIAITFNSQFATAADVPTELTDAEKALGLTPVKDQSFEDRVEAVNAVLDTLGEKKPARSEALSVRFQNIREYFDSLHANRNYELRRLEVLLKLNSDPKKSFFQRIEKIRTELGLSETVTDTSDEAVLKASLYQELKVRNPKETDEKLTERTDAIFAEQVASLEKLEKQLGRDPGLNNHYPFERLQSIEKRLSLNGNAQFDGFKAQLSRADKVANTPNRTFPELPSLNEQMAALEKRLDLVPPKISSLSSEMNAVEQKLEIATNERVNLAARLSVAEAIANEKFPPPKRLSVEEFLKQGQEELASLNTLARKFSVIFAPDSPIVERIEKLEKAAGIFHDDPQQRQDRDRIKNLEELASKLAVKEAPSPIPTPADRDPNLPLIRSRKISLDLGFDLDPSKPISKDDEAKIRKRLSAIVFAVNSLNTSKKDILSVKDLLRNIPKNGPVHVELDLGPYLSDVQIAQVEKILAKEPMVCDGESQVRAGQIRADVFVGALFQRKNYYDLMGLKSRSEFETQLGIESEFDAAVPDRAKFTSTKRFLIAPGQSGVAHTNAYRGLIVQKGKDGALVIRTADVNTDLASKPEHNFAVSPATAKPNGHEDIWTLPNGMRGYALRAGNGDLVTDAPANLVQPKIANPTSCLKCHGDAGYIATTGDHDSKDLKNLRDVAVSDELGVGKKLFSSKWKEYPDEIKKANEAYESALEKSGASAKSFRDVLAKYEAPVPLDTLALEVGVSRDKLDAALKGDVRFHEAIASLPEGETALKKGELPQTLSRTAVEGPVSQGKNQTQSLFCSLKEHLIAFNPFFGGLRDAVVHGAKQTPLRGKQLGDSHL